VSDADDRIREFVDRGRNAQAAVDDVTATAAALARFEHFDDEHLRGYRAALLLDREAAIGGQRTIDFCDATIAMIDRVLRARA
jgi:hypothetical protein